MKRAGQITEDRWGKSEILGFYTEQEVAVDELRAEMFTGRYWVL